MAGQFGRVLGNPQASGGVFLRTIDGQGIDRPGAAVPGYCSTVPGVLSLSSGSRLPAGAGQPVPALARLSLSSGSRSMVSGSE